MQFLQGILPSLFGATPAPEGPSPASSAPVGPLVDPMASVPSPLLLGGDAGATPSAVAEGPLRALGANEDLKKSLKKEYGVRPRDYANFLDGSNAAEREMLAELPEITRFLNQQAKANGHDFRFSQQELLTNFLTEGGVNLLTSNQTRDIDGYSALGIDTFVDRKKQLAPWMTPDLEKLVKSGKRRATNINEQGQEVHTINPESLGQGLRANAAMFALSREQLHGEMTKQGKDGAALTPEEQFFWTTVYYNAGPGFGKRMLNDNGVDWAHKKWTGADDHGQNSMHPRFNAAWRTATFDYLSQTSTTAPEQPVEHGGLPLLQ